MTPPSTPATTATTRAERAIRTDAGLAVLRIGLAVLLLAHGAQKLFEYGIPGVSGAFTEAGVPLAGAAATAAALIEAVGGLAILLGIGSRIAAVLVAVEMLVAIFTMHLGAGYFADGGGAELPLLVASTALGIALAGPGRYSLAGLLLARRSQLLA